MTEKEADALLFAAFMLGIRAMHQAHDLSIPGSEANKVFDILREIATGKFVLDNGPSEAIAKYPSMSAHMQEWLQRVSPALHVNDKMLAQRILRFHGER